MSDLDHAKHNTANAVTLLNHIMAIRTYAWVSIRDPWTAFIYFNEITTDSSYLKGMGPKSQSGFRVRICIPGIYLSLYSLISKLGSRG